MKYSLYVMIFSPYNVVRAPEKGSYFFTRKEDVHFLTMG